MEQRLVNTFTLCGYMEEKAEFSHFGKNIRYMTFTLGVPRLSSYVDKIKVICDEEILKSLNLECEKRIKIQGELHSFNNKSGIGSKLKIFMQAKEISFCDEDFQNSLYLMGTICKPPKWRSTPLGREICDLLLAVNRPNGHSDYIPCICWGENAKIAASFYVGDTIELEGRLQSRDYIKNEEGISVRKTTYEVSSSSVWGG